MTHSTKFIAAALSAIVITFAVAPIHAPPAAAETASELDCRGCINSRQVKNRGIKTRDLRDSAVTGSKIAEGAVTGSKIANNAVTGGKIAGGAISSSEVANESLAATDLSNEAGAGFASGDQTIVLSNDNVIVRSLSITAPADGIVIVNVSGYFGFSDQGHQFARCWVTTGTDTVFETSHLMPASNRGVETHAGLVPFAGTRGYNVEAGTTTFNLVCDVTGVSDNTQVKDTSITAMYFPTAY